VAAVEALPGAMARRTLDSQSMQLGEPVGDLLPGRGAVVGRGDHAVGADEDDTEQPGQPETVLNHGGLLMGEREREPRQTQRVTGLAKVADLDREHFRDGPVLGQGLQREQRVAAARARLAPLVEDQVRGEKRQHEGFAGHVFKPDPATLDQVSDRRQALAAGPRSRNITGMFREAYRIPPSVFHLELR